VFVVFLEFSENRGRAGELMDGHKAWLTSGFDDGVFILAGSLQPGRGGAILAHGVSLSDLESRVADDPFVVENVVTASISEISPSRVDDRLSFVDA
jgi:uncharacterized protein YciI